MIEVSDIQKATLAMWDAFNPRLMYVTADQEAAIEKAAEDYERWHVQLHSVTGLRRLFGLY